MKSLTTTLITVLALAATVSCAQASPISYEVEPVDPSVRENFLQRERGAHVLVDKENHVWGASVIRWTDGQYHAFFSQWPDQTNHAGWLTHCSVMHGVADQPQGPYETVGTAVAPRRPDSGRKINAHNPCALVAEGKVLLYFINDDLSKLYTPTADAPFPSDEWLAEHRLPDIRNAQVTDVAIADSPDGPFQIPKETVVDPNTQPSFKNIAVNPAVVYQDGTYRMVIKGDDPAKEEWHRIQLVGTSENPGGPFTFSERPVYAERQTEDACVWYNQVDQTYNMVCHVMGSRDLAWFVSGDGDHWRFADNPVFMKKSIPLSDGSVWKPARVERPFVLTNDKGEPQWIFVAIADKGFNGNIALRLKKAAADIPASIPE